MPLALIAAAALPLLAAASPPSNAASISVKIKHGAAFFLEQPNETVPPDND